MWHGFKPMIEFKKRTDLNILLCLRQGLWVRNYTDGNIINHSALLGFSVHSIHTDTITWKPFIGFELGNNLIPQFRNLNCGQNRMQIINTWHKGRAVRWEEVGKKREANMLCTTSGTGNRDLSFTVSWEIKTTILETKAEYPVSETRGIRPGSQ